VSIRRFIRPQSALDPVGIVVTNPMGVCMRTSDPPARKENFGFFNVRQASPPGAAGDTRS
jgi:hypothetical protein